MRNVRAVEAGEISRRVDAQIEAQRERLWQVRGIIDTVRQSLDSDGQSIEATDAAQPLFWSLTAASELIEDINDQLDRVGMANEEVAHG